MEKNVSLDSLQSRGRHFIFLIPLPLDLKADYYLGCSPTRKECMQEHLILEYFDL